MGHTDCRSRWDMPAQLENGVDGSYRLPQPMGHTGAARERSRWDIPIAVCRWEIPARALSFEQAEGCLDRGNLTSFFLKTCVLSGGTWDLPR